MWAREMWARELWAGEMWAGEMWAKTRENSERTGRPGDNKRIGQYPALISFKLDHMLPMPTKAPRRCVPTEGLRQREGLAALHRDAPGMKADQKGNDRRDMLDWPHGAPAMCWGWLEA